MLQHVACVYIYISSLRTIRWYSTFTQVIMVYHTRHNNTTFVQMYEISDVYQQMNSSREQCGASRRVTRWTLYAGLHCYQVASVRPRQLQALSATVVGGRPVCTAANIVRTYYIVGLLQVLMSTITQPSSRDLDGHHCRVSPLLTSKTRSDVQLSSSNP